MDKSGRRFVVRFGLDKGQKPMTAKTHRYLRFSLSYRDVEELLAERGLHADHVTVWRWVQRYAPEMERRLRSELKPTNDSWRVDSDLHTGQGQVGLFIPRRGLDRGDDRLLALGQAGRGCCGALPE